MSDYAQAINRALQESADQLRDYGGFLAQAQMPLAEVEGLSFDEWKVVKQGYDRQRFNFPNG